MTFFLTLCVYASDYDFIDLPIHNLNYNIVDNNKLLPLILEDSVFNIILVDGIQISGKNIHYSMNAWSIEDGVISDSDNILIANEIHYNQNTKILEAIGNVRFEGDTFRLMCHKIIVDWHHKIGQVMDLTFKFQPNWTLKSKSAYFNTLHKWEFHKVIVSPCLEESYGWKAIASKIMVNLNGYSYLSNPWLSIYGLPWHYIPYLVYPTTLQRVSGIWIYFDLYKSFGIRCYKTFGDIADITFFPYFKKNKVVWREELRWHPYINHQGKILGSIINYDSKNTLGYKKNSQYYLNINDIWKYKNDSELFIDIKCASGQPLNCDVDCDNFGLLKEITNNSLERNDYFVLNSNMYFKKKKPYGIIDIGTVQQLHTYGGKARYKDFLSYQTRVIPSIKFKFNSMQKNSFYFDCNLRFDHLYSMPIELDDKNTTYVAIEGMSNRYDASFKILKGFSILTPVQINLIFGSRITYYTSILDREFYVLKQHTGMRLMNTSRIELVSLPFVRIFENIILGKQRHMVKHLVSPYCALINNDNSLLKGHVTNIDDVDLRPGINGSVNSEHSLEFGLNQNILYRLSSYLPFLDVLHWKMATKYDFNTVKLSKIEFHKRGWRPLHQEIGIEFYQLGGKFVVALRRGDNTIASSNNKAVFIECNVSNSYFNAILFSNIQSLAIKNHNKGIQISSAKIFADDKMKLEFLCNYSFSNKVLNLAKFGITHSKSCVSETLYVSHISRYLTNNDSLHAKRENRIDLVISLTELGNVLKQPLSKMIHF